MRAGDLGLVRWAGDVNVSNDAARVAWCEVALDLERDEPVSNIMVATTKEAGQARRFSDGPHDSSPRWGTGGRYLAYLSVASGPPALCLAPLDGGAPLKVDTPGPVRSFDWSPSGDRLVLVINLGGRRADSDDAKESNTARVVRGTFNRLDGAGWLAGRDHLFAYDISRRALSQISSGDYDHAQPSWSPDGSSVVFVSDRSRRRDDRVGCGDIWMVAATGGRPRRLVGGIGWAAFPTFSPESNRVAFGGLLGAEQRAGRDARVLVVGADGAGEPEQLAPDLDRPVGFSLDAKAYVWVSDDELVFTVADRGTIGLWRARLGERSG